MSRRKIRRPWRVTIPGGRCLATYRYKEHATEKAEVLVASGKLPVAFVHRKGESRFIEIRRRERGPVGDVATALQWLVDFEAPARHVVDVPTGGRV